MLPLSRWNMITSILLLLSLTRSWVTILDGGPNNGYEYVTSSSNNYQGNTTNYAYIVVTDVLAATTFYKAQCGTYSSTNTSGLIAGSQLKQNIFDHEQGTVLSHWTEYRDAQNLSTNNLGTVLESATAPPGSSGNTFGTNVADAAETRIAQAVAVEPCGGSVNNDSSQACAYCGGINFLPYQSCGSSTPAPQCH